MTAKKAETAAKTPLHLRLTNTDWIEVFKELNRAELGVLFYIRTLDPYGDRDLEIEPSTVGKILGLHRTTVSRALEALSSKNLIEMEVLKARVRNCIKNKKITLLLLGQENQSNDEQSEDTTSCASTHTDEHPRTEESADALDGVCRHTDEHPRTIQEPEAAPSMGFKIPHTLTDLNKTSSYSLKSESEKIELCQESGTGTSTSTLAVTVQEVQSLVGIKRSGGDKFFAPPAPEVHWTLKYDGDNTPWLNPPRNDRGDINFNPDFLDWQGKRWKDNFGSPDLAGAIANFRASLINKPERIQIRWDEYQMHFSQRLQSNMALHEAGIAIPEAEQKHLVQHSRALKGFVVEEAPVLAPAAKEVPILTESPEPSPLPSKAPKGAENPDSYRIFTAASLPERTAPPAEVLEKLRNLSKNIGKKMPKATQTTDEPEETELEWLNRRIKDPSYRAQIIAKVEKSDRWIVDYDEKGIPSVSEF
jgi:hypothetical protein